MQNVWWQVETSDDTGVTNMSYVSNEDNVHVTDIGSIPAVVQVSF